MILENIEVESFRNLPATTYPLGKRITVIGGHNGTGKSTLLGLIAQPFGMAIKDIWGYSLSAKFETKFKLSMQYDKYEAGNRYKYYINTLYRLD